MKDRVIFSAIIAGKIMAQGIPMKNARPDYRNPNHIIYFFEDTDEFRKAYAKIGEELKAR